MSTMNEFERCLKERRLIEIKPSKEMIKKELKGAEYDLASAEESLQDGDYKWSSVQSYYSMFHAAKALVLKKSYREKSHYCLLVALKELYVKAGELESECIENFEMSMDIRHEADYALLYEEESARLVYENAERFLDKTRSILEK